MKYLHTGIIFDIFNKAGPLKKYLYIFFLFFFFKGYSTHIVGGEIYYDFLGKTPSGMDQYRITLKLYRDCNNSGNANFDFGLYLTVIGNGQQNVINIGSPSIKRIPPTLNSSCNTIPDMCVEEGVYIYTLTLQPAAGGYYVIYQRCCRNGTILNLNFPGSQGTTCYVKIPGPELAVENSSPRFDKFPPILLCNSVPFYFDHAATDPDGDELEYSLGAPFQGLDGCCPILFTSPQNSSVCPSVPASCPQISDPPPYSTVKYATPYSATYPLASSPALAIDPQTGKITASPNLIGQFVVCVQVKEKRNGQIINIHYRDFQFNVVSCIIPVLADMADQIKKCMGNVITFTNQSVSTTGGLTYKWNFGDPTTVSDTSLLVDPTYQFPDTGWYQVTLIGNPGKPCSDTAKKAFYIHPPMTVGFPQNPAQCIKNNSFAFYAQSNYLATGSFAWTFPAKATPSVSTAKSPNNIQFSEPGKYFVKLVGRQYHCIDSFIDSVRVIDKATAKILSPPAAFCCPASFSFSNTIVCEEQFKFRWNFSDGKSSTENVPLKSFTVAGVYGASLSVISEGVCKDTISVSINHFTVHPVPAGSFKVIPKTTTILDPVISVKSTTTEGLSYEYDFGDGNSINTRDPYHAYYNYGSYVITEYLTNSFGCKDTLRDVVQILPDHVFWIPNAFTPDANDLNDLFRPTLAGISNYEFEVFDRWGNRLFRTNDPVQGWDGRDKGIVCQQGVYIWKVSYKDIVTDVDHKRDGHVTLLKNQ